MPMSFQLLIYFLLHRPVPLIQVLDLQSLSKCHLKFISIIPHSSTLKYIFLRGRYFATWSVFLTQFNYISYPINFLVH